MTRGLIVAAPASGSGKTMVALALLRCLRREGMRVAAAKVGPDYIDPAYLARAGGGECVNLDPWGMRETTLRRVVETAFRDAQLVVCEGVMGLFDGATGSEGSTAELAGLTGWPVLLVIDVAAQAASAAAVARGFASHDPTVEIAGIVFNRAGGEAHEAVLRDACRNAVPALPVLGCIPATADLALPERHLGLVQAGEREDLEDFLERAADVVGGRLDVAATVARARPARRLPEERRTTPAAPPFLPPLGSRVAVARDEAFAFAYPTVLSAWREAGAEVRFFSPLAGEAPDPTADAIYLPGGYPELHAERIAANRVFLDGLRAAAARALPIYGECGGYMVLGRSLVDGEGTGHAMAGLLPLETSFAERSLRIGYRKAELLSACPLGAPGARFRGHEFHAATTLVEGPGDSLFRTASASGRGLGEQGLVAGSVAGSFVHLIDRDEA